MLGNLVHGVISLAVAAAGWVGFRSPGDYAAFKFPPLPRHDPRQVKGALKAMPIKTDRRDAEGIARLLHLGWFRPVHCKSVSAQELRTLLGARKAVQQGMIPLEMSPRGLLRNFGLKVGPTSRGRFHIRIRELVDGNTMLSAATEPMLSARAALRQELAGL